MKSKIQLRELNSPGAAGARKTASRLQNAEPAWSRAPGSYLGGRPGPPALGIARDPSISPHRIYLDQAVNARGTAALPIRPDRGSPANFYPPSRRRGPGRTP